MDKECVAVLIELYKKNVTVSCVGSDVDLLSEYIIEPRVVVIPVHAHILPYTAVEVVEINANM